MIYLPGDTVSDPQVLGMDAACTVTTGGDYGTVAVAVLTANGWTPVSILAVNSSGCVPLATGGAAVRYTVSCDVTSNITVTVQ